MDLLTENAKIKELTLDELKKLNGKEADFRKENMNDKESIEEFTEEEAIVEQILSENK